MKSRRDLLKALPFLGVLPFFRLSPENNVTILGSVPLANPGQIAVVRETEATFSRPDLVKTFHSFKKLGKVEILHHDEAIVVSIEGRGWVSIVPGTEGRGFDVSYTVYEEFREPSEREKMMKAHTVVTKSGKILKTRNSDHTVMVVDD